MYGLVLFFISFIGIMLIFGAYKRWSWLIDPPLDWAWFYSQAWLKKTLGKKGLLIYTYLIGSILLGAGIAGTIVLVF